MSKKPKFLLRISQLGDHFASLGRQLKKDKQTGPKSQVLKKRYKEAQEFQRVVNVSVRHLKWKKLYESVFEKEYKKARVQLNRTKKQAFNYARQKAEQAVVDEFPDEVTTTRAVRMAMNEISEFSDPKQFSL